MGLVLFDIDGTLSTGTQNEAVVQYFLDNKYAVGISTANSSYTIENIHTISCIPNNLYNFMRFHHFSTFNNVGNGILRGEQNPFVYGIQNLVYTHLYGGKTYNIGHHLGYLKGMTLQKTAMIYNITDPHFMILIDNDPDYISGCLDYNNCFTVIAGGKPASHMNLSLHLISPKYS